MWITAIRRSVFGLVLLTIGVITEGGFYLGINTRWGHGMGTRAPDTLAAFLHAFGIFAWGARSVGVVFAVSLVGRHRVWRNWSGRTRVIAYLLAYGYGGMLFRATQNWLRLMGRGSPSEVASFVWPGAHLQDDEQPMHDLLRLLTMVWLLVPVFALCRGTLVEREVEVQKTSTFSIATMMGWITAAAAIMGIVPRTAYNFTPKDALIEFLGERLPGHLIFIAATMLFVVACSGRWWVSIGALILALLIDGLGQQFLHWIIGKNDSGVLTGPWQDRWCYLAGRNFIVWTAFSMARQTGITFKRHRNQTV